MADVALKSEMTDASIEVDLGPDAQFRDCQKLWAAALHRNLVDSLTNQVRAERGEAQVCAHETKAASWWQSSNVVHFAEAAGMDGDAFQSRLCKQVAALGAGAVLKKVSKIRGRPAMGVNF